jgi:two-component system chemotaxis response regulator CheY
MLPDPASAAPRPLALVVDDSEQIRRDACRIVESFGFDAASAADAEGGLRQCAAQVPALILVDWMMPGMGGLDFLKALRAIPTGYRATVIFLSGNGRPPDIHLAMRSGASEYLMKPFDSDLLSFKLRQVGLIAA